MVPSTNTESSTRVDRRQRDCRGLPLTTASLEAAAHYREAIDRVHGAEPGAADLLDRAIACDPAFALAHVARAMLAHGDGDAETSRVARGAAFALRERVSDWELGHIDCLIALIERRPGAWDLIKAHLAAHPKDLLVISQLIGDLFFHGGEGKRQAVVGVLEPLASQLAGDWAFEARLGFHLSELGRPGPALALLWPALEARPGAPFIAHAIAHALGAAGDRDAAERFLSDWVTRHDHTGPLDGHIQWHLAVAELDRADPVAAVRRYVRSTAPGANHCAAGLALADAGGLFCRMWLDGLPLDDLPREQLREPLAKLSRTRMPFVAVHVAALAAALGDREAMNRSIEVTRGHAGTTVEAGHRVVVAFHAYAAGDMRTCLDALEPGRPELWEAVGGSNEERALIAKLHERAAAEFGAPQ